MSHFVARRASVAVLEFGHPDVARHFRHVEHGLIPGHRQTTTVGSHGADGKARPVRVMVCLLPCCGATVSEVDGVSTAFPFTNLVM